MMLHGRAANRGQIRNRTISITACARLCSPRVARRRRAGAGQSMARRSPADVYATTLSATSASISPSARARRSERFASRGALGDPLSQNGLDDRVEATRRSRARYRQLLRSRRRGDRGRPSSSTRLQEKREGGDPRLAGCRGERAKRLSLSRRGCCHPGLVEHSRRNRRPVARERDAGPRETAMRPTTSGK